MKKTIDENWEDKFDVIFGTDNEFALGDNSVHRVKVFIKDELTSYRQELVEKVDGMHNDGLHPDTGLPYGSIHAKGYVKGYNQALDEILTLLKEDNK